MDEFPGLFPQENFFDDGDDHILGRIEDNEDPLDFGLHEADEDEIHNYNQQNNQQIAQTDMDLRMEGRSNHRGSSVNQAPPKALYKGSQNTGPKGVLKDYKDSKNAVHVNRIFDELRQARTIQQRASGKKYYYLDHNNEVQGYCKKYDQTGNGDDPHEPESLKYGVRSRLAATRLNHNDDDDDDPDDDILQSIRAKQAMLQHYQDEVYETQSQIGGNYLRVENIDQLSSILKSAHKDGITLIHLYDNINPSCQIIHLILEDLAPMFPHVAFIRARTQEVMPSFDVRFLPTFLVYKGTECKEKLIGITGTIGMKPTDDDVVNFLAKHQVLQMPTAGLDTQIKAEMHRRQFLDTLDADDDDWLNED